MERDLLESLICDHCDRKDTDVCPEPIDCRRYKFQDELYRRTLKKIKGRYTEGVRNI